MIAGRSGDVGNRLDRSGRRAAALALVVLAACAGAPRDRKPAGPTVLISDSPARPAPRAAPARPDPVRQVNAMFGVLADGPALDLVREVGARVAAVSPRRDVPYVFGIVDRPEPNAFALPTGHVFVSRGLLALLNSPDELAGVLGHEVAHVAGRHLEAREDQALAATILSVLAGVASGFASDARSAALGGPASQAAAAASVASFSREQEREADRQGERYAAAAGFAEDGLALALRALDHDRRLREGASPLPGFFDSHPGGPERFASAASRAAGAGRAERPSDPAAERARTEIFLRRLDGLVVGPDPAQGVFRGARFLHAGLDLTMRFPERWRFVNTPSAVAAVTPEGDAAIVLEMSVPRPTLEATANADALARGLDAIELDRLRIGDAPALRVRGMAPSSGGGGIEALDVTWIARQDGIYRISGRTSEPKFRRLADTFLATAKTFRRMTKAERSGIEVLRLRLAPALGDESLADVARRTGTPWTPAEIALANGLPQGLLLPGAILLKVALPEPWEPSPAPSASPAPAGAEVPESSPSAGEPR
jgi:predicted Zn-dependent protease